MRNRRSHSANLIYVDNAMINFYSKIQNTVESSNFVSEFVALIIFTEMVEAIRYKLKIFGVNLEGTAEVYCDNSSVVTNYSVSSTILNKIHKDIC